MKCKQCGATLDLTMSACPSCGKEVELGRLTGILGMVCRSCDAYNEPGVKICAACGKPLGTQPVEPAPPPPAPAPPAPAAAAPAVTPAVPAAAANRPKPAATRFVPSQARASGPAAPLDVTPPAPAGPGGPVALVTKCPRCGADAQGAFCASCGQPLGPRGTAVMRTTPAPGVKTATQIFGALTPGRAKLVLERGSGNEGSTFRLNAESVEAGRTKGAVIFPDDPCLAPHHATFFYREGNLHVRDEGAPGGLYLRLRGLSVPIRPGDHFVVGDRLLRYAGPLPPSPPGPPDGTRRLGAPRPTGNAVVIEEWMEGGAAGRVYVRGGPSVTIGRAGCAVNLGDDPFLSQAHAEVLVEPDGNARLRDLSSSNGTFVRVPPHGERELRDGDCVRLGREVLRVAVA
ncbi:MAG: FHA domain-containing protein [Anaeromyxobacter sp.]